MITALFFFVLFALVISFYQNNKKIIGPSFLFVAPFLVAVLVALFNYSNWNLKDFSFITFLTITLGLFVFILGSGFYNLLFGRNRFGHKKNKFDFASLTDGKLIFTLIIELVGSLIYLYLMISWGRSRGYNLSDAIFNSMYAGKFHTEDERLDLPFIINSLIICGKAVSYICMAVLAKNIIYKQNKHDLLLVLNILVPFFTTFLSGSRGESMNMIVAFIVLLCFYFYKKNSWKKQIPNKLIFISAALFAVVLFLFFSLQTLIGRDEFSGSFIDNLSVYLGAQIKNFDVYLMGETYHTVHPGYSTFSGFYSMLNSYLKFDISESIPDLPFVFINNKSLGNVYSCFYSYYIDGGIFGVLLFSFLSGYTSQWLFCKARRHSNDNINFWLVVYSYAAANLVFCFFGARFFSNLISAGYIRQIIWILIVKAFFTKFSFVKNDYIVSIPQRRLG